MTKENVIPQLFIVALLRVLLTTCPNASKNSGGIDIHREWNSVLVLQKSNEEYKKIKLNPPEEEKKEEEKKQGKKAQEADWKKAILDELNKESEHKNSTNNEAMCDVPEFQTEYNRHRFIIGFIITRIYVYVLGHLKSNCTALASPCG